MLRKKILENSEFGIIVVADRIKMHDRYIFLKNDSFLKKIMIMFVL